MKESSRPTTAVHTWERETGLHAPFRPLIDAIPIDPGRWEAVIRRSKLKGVIELVAKPGRNGLKSTAFSRSLNVRT
jgi:hypothetical protein